MELNEFKDRYIFGLPKTPKGLDLGLDKFYKYEANLIRVSGLSTIDGDHLINVGMPKQASPFLSFSDFPNWDCEPSKYFPIGADGSGSNICVDLDNGEVVILDHDWEMKRVFINSSLRAFSECLCIFQECLRNGRLEQCITLMMGADPALLKDSEWWSNEIKSS